MNIVTKKGFVSPYTKKPILYLETVEKGDKVHRSYDFLKLLITMKHVKDDKDRFALYISAIEEIERIEK